MTFMTRRTLSNRDAVLFFVAGVALAWFAPSWLHGEAAPEAAVSRTLRARSAEQHPVPAIELIDLTDTEPEVVWTWM